MSKLPIRRLIGCLLASTLLLACGEKVDPSRERNLYAIQHRKINPAALENQVQVLPETTLTIDAMVGQINGRPIYASQVFDRIGDIWLIERGSKLPRLEFKREVTKQILAYLRQIINDELILAEAEQSLSPQEKQGLLGILSVEKEKIFARFLGSPERTRRKLMEEYDQTLEEYMESKRQEILVQKYLQDRLWPKIHVTRRDVEKYYRDNHAQFNPDPEVTVRLMLVRDSDVADQVDKALKEEKPFADVAGDYSIRNADQGGLMPPFKTRIEAFKGFRWQNLNDKVKQLKEVGQATDRTEIQLGSSTVYAWVYLDKIEGGQAVPLNEVYLKIEQLLTRTQFDYLSRKYMVELMEKGNFTPVEQMLLPLIDVAMSRYAQTQ